MIDISIFKTTLLLSQFGQNYTKPKLFRRFWLFLNAVFIGFLKQKKLKSMKYPNTNTTQKVSS
jgi:hypothetical protein